MSGAWMFEIELKSRQGLRDYTTHLSLELRIAIANATITRKLKLAVTRVRSRYQMYNASAYLPRTAALHGISTLR